MATLSPEHHKTVGHLKTLSILYYVAAGLSVFPLCFGALYGGIGLMFLTGSIQPPPQNPNEPPIEVMGWVFFLLGLFVALTGVLSAVLDILVARRLTQHRWYWYCFVMAVLHCLSVPLGTVLGVFTIIVMLKPEAKQLFGQEPMPRWSPAPQTPRAAPPTAPY